MGVALAYEFVHALVVVFHVVKVYFFALRYLDYIEGFFDVGERAKSQKVHFEKPELLALYHVELGGYVAVARFCHGNVVGYGVATDYYARGVHARLPRHTLNLHRHIENNPRHFVIFVHFRKLAYNRTGLVIFPFLKPEYVRQVLFAHHCGYQFGYLFHLGVRIVVYPPHVFHRRFRRHRAERDNLRHVGRAVLFGYVLNYEFALVHAKVYIEIGVRHALGVEKAFEYELILERVNLCYAYSVRHYTARAAAAPRSYGNVVRFRPVNEIPNY